MPRRPRTILYVGIKDSVVALDAATGAELWRQVLKAADFVSVFFDGVNVYATNRGEIWAFDPQSGTPRWHNEMKGLGRGLMSLASTAVPMSATSPADVEHQQREAAAAAAAAAG
jgi:outer membrane protein assembly factor BamB